MNPRQRAIEQLCSALGLIKPSAYMQDWAYVVADELRIGEFMQYYNQNMLNDDMKILLMIIVVESCNDAVGNKHLSMSDWKKVKAALRYCA